MKCAHLCMHRHGYLCAHVYTWIYSHVCTYVHVSIASADVHVCRCACMCADLHVCVGVNTCICVLMYMYVEKAFWYQATGSERTFTYTFENWNTEGEYTSKWGWRHRQAQIKQCLKVMLRMWIFFFFILIASCNLCRNLGNGMPQMRLVFQEKSLTVLRVDGSQMDLWPQLSSWTPGQNLQWSAGYLPPGA